MIYLSTGKYFYSFIRHWTFMSHVRSVCCRFLHRKWRNLIQVFTNGFRGIVVKEKVYCTDLGTSQGGEQTCFLWKMNQRGWPDRKQTACQLKCQINLSSDQVENNWNVSPCNTTESNWNIAQRQAQSFLLAKSSLYQRRFFSSITHGQ